MNFDELRRFLEKRTREPMPGDEAHQKMKPRMLDGTPFQLKHSQPPKNGGVLILLYEEDDTIRFPLIQRPTYEGIHSGQMALPGGKQEGEDADQYETALRETHEEIGVKPKEIEIVGSLSEFYVVASNYMVMPVIGVVSGKPTFIPEPREVADIVTPSLSDLIEPKKAKEKDMVVRKGFLMHCPYYDLEGRVVWGATAMMLSELVDIVKEF